VDAGGMPFAKSVALAMVAYRFKLLLIILMSIISVGCKTAEQQQLEKYQNLKSPEWEFIDL